MLIDEMRILGTRNSSKYLNLGGGLGSSRDSLFRFKSSFSNNFKDFKVWNFIVDQKIYDHLVQTYSVQKNHDDFFPKYRNNS